MTVAPEKTRILDAALLIGAGIVAACQVGKAFIAMPLIIVDLKIGVDVGSMILAVVALIGAIGAMPVSMVLRRLGAGRARIFGLVAIGIGSAIGAIAADAPILIFSRAIEGLGLLATVLVIPDLLQQTVAPRDRDLMLAIWGSYMPIGTVLMLLLGPALPEIGWRTLWAFNAILPIAYAALCFLRFGLGERGPLGTSPLSDIEALFQRAHRFIWHWLSDFTLSLMSRLPGSCRSSLSRNCICLSLPRACSRRLLSRRMSSAIIMAGVLLRAGVPIWANVAMSFTVYGIVSLVIFASGVGGGVIAMTAAITLGIGGLSPGSIFAGVPRFAPNPRRASSPQADATGTRDCQSSPIMTRLAGRLYSGGPHSSSRLPCRAASRVES
ncbi:MAG TPA: MFS transporter [Beijerinckiaceae bacterium]|nr:MFS transporter [Beijerinckiaceae bacterium]